MSQLELLQERIRQLKAELSKLESKPKVRRSNNPRSRYYVTDYARLVPVHNGYVAPEVLDMYKEENV